MTKRTPEKIERLRELASTGQFAITIAGMLDVSADSIADWAAKEGVTLLTRSQAMCKSHARPTVRQRMKATKYGAKNVQVPAWVPRDLHDEFLEIAGMQDEFAAARHIRRLKADMLATSPPTAPEAGAVTAEILGVPFPLQMRALVARAKERGFDPTELWPWYSVAPGRAILASHPPIARKP